MVRDSAEASAEASVDPAEASVSAESHFRAIRSFTTEDLQNERRIEKVASISQSLCGSSYQDYWGYEINCTSTIVSKSSWKLTKKFYFYVPLRTI